MIERDQAARWQHQHRAVWLINGASDNYSNPLVATNPGWAPSQVTWTTVDLNGKHAADTQEVHTAPGPF